MQNLNRLATLLLPSKGRLKLLLQLLSYFQRTKLPFKILILGSGDEYQNSLNNFDDLDLEIVLCQPETSLMEKLQVGSELIKTPFVCVCTDDDLVIAESLINCVEFLNNNPTYSACQGFHNFFQEQEHNIYMHDYAYTVPSIENDSQLNRLANLFNAYQPITWAVFQTKVYQKITKKITEFKYLKGIFSELLWSTFAVIEGKVKRLPEPFCHKRVNELLHEWHPFYAFISSPSKFCSDYQIFKKCISQSIQDTKYNPQEIDYLLDLICTKYFCFEYDRGKLCYTIDELLKNPKLTCYSDPIFNVIKMRSANFDHGNARIISQDNIKYYFSKNFLDVHSSELKEPLHKSNLLKHLSLYFKNDDIVSPKTHKSRVKAFLRRLYTFTK